MRCPSCAYENPDGQKFCGECGARLDPGQIREERKVVTALFCDLVGSTALGERMDHEDVAHLLLRYQQLCSKAITSHGGVVEKFIGDAVVGVFGVPAAHEDDPERAVRAALHIVNDIAGSDLPIQARIGVNTGEALVRLGTGPDEGFATGDAMNTTARLEAAAPVMGVAVSETTHAATSGLFAFEELDPIVAKGKAEPLRAWRAAEPIARAAMPDADKTPFVGRELEFSMLTQLFDRSRSRPSTEIVTIVADPGLGKSRLVRELRRHVERVSDVVNWREGRCLPYGDGVSFWALGEIVKAQAGILETDEATDIHDKLHRAVLEPDPQTSAWIVDRLAPLVGLETSSEPPKEDEAFTAWRRFIEGMAASAPTVLVIEDLHWADDGFVGFLTHLAERTAGLPLLLVVTARPELEERHPSWPPSRRSTALPLWPLGTSDVEALVVASLPDADDSIKRIILDRSGGSPLFAEQLAMMISERGLPVAGGALDETDIPRSIQALIAARIDALPAGSKQVLMEASVVGKTFWRGAVASLGEHEDLGISLGDLVRRELLRASHPSSMEGDDEFTFWHAFVRDVAYAELTKAERARLHAATATWIVGSAGGAVAEDAEIVIHHIDAASELASSAPDLDLDPLRDVLCDALIRASRSAMRTDISQAPALLERALAVIDPADTRRPEALALLGRVITETGDMRDAALRLGEAADWYRQRGDTRSIATFAVPLATALSSTGNDERADALLEEARLTLSAEPNDDLVTVMCAQAWSALTQDHIALARSIVGDAFALSAQIDGPLSLRLLRLRGVLRLMEDDREGEKDLRDVVAQATALGDFIIAGGALSSLGFYTCSNSDSLAAYDEAMALQEAHGLDVVSTRSARLATLYAAGRWDELLAEAPIVRKQAEAAGQAMTAWIIDFHTSAVRAERGQRIGSQSMLVASGREFGFPPIYAGTIAAEAARLEGDMSAARTFLAESLAETGDGEVNAIGIFVNACLRSDAPDLARRALAKGTVIDTINAAETAMASGLVAEHDGEVETAFALFDEASAALGSMEFVPNQAYALAGLGRIRLAMGDSVGGKASLQHARELWQQIGSPPRLAEIEASLGTSVGGGEL